MQVLQRSLLLGACVYTLVLPAAGPACARQTIVTGSAGTGYDFRDRTYKEAQADTGNEGDAQRIYIEPAVTVVSQGVYDTLNVHYAPQLGYDFVDNESNVNHQLNVSDERYLSQHWSLTLSDDFRRSDDPETSNSLMSTTAAGSEDTGGVTQDVLSNDRSGHRYWTNTAGLSTSYALFENTRLGGGYNYSVLRNETGSDAYDEYDKQIGRASCRERV